MEQFCKIINVRSRQPVWPKKESALTQYVLMSHQDSLVDLSLSEPTGLLSGEENFHSHFFSPPLAHPHLSIPPLAYLLHHLNLLGYCSLHLRRSKRWEKVKYCLLFRSWPMCVLQFVYLTNRGSPEPEPELCDCSIKSFRDSPGGM